MITILAFVVTLGILIVVHEYGHYRTAVACGVKVLRFSVGFGRVLWRHQKRPDSTEFTLCALPLGGYVKMLDERELEPGAVAPEDLPRAFNRQSLAKRAAIVVAGPLANLALAVLLYSAVHWMGIDEPRAVIATPPAGSLAAAAGLQGGQRIQAWARDDQPWEDVASMSDLRWQLTQGALDGALLRLRVSDREGGGAHEARLDLSSLQGEEVDAALVQRIGLGSVYQEPLIGEVREGGAAAEAGIRRGDRVLAIDGQAIADSQALVERIRASAAQAEAGAERAPAQHWRVERAGQVIEVDVAPRIAGEGAARIGRVEAGVGGAVEMVTVRYGALDGLVLGARRTWEVSALTVRMLGRMIVGQASIKNLSGPLTIADAAGQSAQLGLAYYVGFLALVSVSLGVLNLLPLPMLDGGHLMYYIFEAVTGRPVSERWLERLQRGGIALLLMMMSVALFNDVVRLLGLH